MIKRGDSAKGPPRRPGGSKLHPVQAGNGGLDSLSDLVQGTGGRDEASELAALQAAIGLLPIGVVIVEAQDEGGARLVACNAAYARIHGRSPQPGTPYRMLDYLLFHSDRRTPVPQEEIPAPKAARTGVSVRDQELHLLRPDGTWRVLSVSAAPIERARGGDPARRSIAVLLDVTEQWTARNTLAASEARFKTLVREMPVGILEADAGGQVLYANPAMEAIAGRPGEALRGEAWRATLHPEDGARVLDAWGAAAAAGQPYEGSFRMVRPDGSSRAVRGQALPLHGERGGVAGYLGMVRDITEELASADALRQSEARFRDVVASADEYVFEVDARGVLTYLSEAAEAVLGRTPEALVGRPYLDLMDPEERPRIGTFLSGQAAAKERFSHHEQMALRPDGRRVWLDVSAVPVRSPAGSLLGYRGTAMDVSGRHEAEAERARLQEQLAQAQKMEVVGRLAGGVAHDFNNLLTVILTCSEELRDALRAGVAPPPGDVDDVLGAARRAAELTRQLLAFARKQVITPEEIHLDEALRQTKRLLGRVIGEDIQVSEQLQPGLWPVRADPGLVSQVLMNLAVNARDAMPRGGALVFGTANVELQPGDPLPDPDMLPGRYVRLTVTDTGTGMPPEVLEHLFEPFFTTKPAGVGTGLGLATVYGILKQSGGFVRVRSQVGQGTTFEIHLPALEAGQATARDDAGGERTGTETVLLVEDDAKIREIIGKVLRTAGYRVHLAADGEEAVAMLRHEAGPIHLVVTDVVMPGMGGREVARRVAEVRPGSRVLFVSGYTHDAISRHGVLDEGIHFLPKPFTAAQLLARVRTVLDGPG